MTLAEFNAAEAGVADGALRRCCGSRQWAESILAERPFPDAAALLAAADAHWWKLAPSDWLEAFASHPKIGDKQGSRWSSQEQSGVATATHAVLGRLAAANEGYQRRFGFIFLVNATGKSASEMLALLEARLLNGDAEELRIAAREQAKITRLRLRKLLDE